MSFPPTLLAIILFLIHPWIVLEASAATPTSIQVKGSDTMVNLGQAWAEAFMKKYPEAYIAVTGGGSGTGIAALIGNTCDIAETSREMKEKEISEARTNGIEPKEFKVALDGLAVVVHTQNPISRLTLDQVADIFTGRITNWEEVGGEDRPIVLLSREVNSGTHVFFREHVIKKGQKDNPDEFTDSALLMPSSQAIADEIRQNPNAIGYYGMGYSGPGQKLIAIAQNHNSPAYLPTIDNVMSDKYEISRPLLMYTKGTPEGVTKEFLNFIFSDEGQNIIKELDFVPIR